MTSPNKYTKEIKWQGPSHVPNSPKYLLLACRASRTQGTFASCGWWVRPWVSSSNAGTSFFSLLSSLKSPYQHLSLRFKNLPSPIPFPCFNFTRKFVKKKKKNWFFFKPSPPRFTLPQKPPGSRCEKQVRQPRVLLLKHRYIDQASYFVDGSCFLLPKAAKSWFISFVMVLHELGN